MKETGFLRADVNEGSLDPREDGLDPPQVYVAYKTPLIGTIEA